MASLRACPSDWVANWLPSSTSSDLGGSCFPFSVSFSSKKTFSIGGKLLQTETNVGKTRELWLSSGGYRTRCFSAVMAAGSVQEILPPALDSTSDPPPVFDGETRLYISYTCPFAQRVWITRNCKGLQDKIKLVPINLKNRPAWYKEKVYPANKVPALEHNKEVRGESLDLIRYIDSQFEGPPLFPEDPVKQAFAEELLSYTNSFSKSVTSSFKGEGNEASAAFDYLETTLSKFEDGPFFLGQFSLVDIAYAPFIERYQYFLQDVKKYDITSGRPKLAVWIEEMNKNEAYTQTRQDPTLLMESYKKRYLANL